MKLTFRTTLKITLSLLAACTSVVQADDSLRPFLAVGRAATPPRIDGVLDDDVWETASCVPFLLQQGRNPEGLKTRTLMTWDDKFLYVASDCPEPKPEHILFRKKGRDAGSMDDDDSFMIFIQAPGEPLYHRFVINTGGYVFDEHHYDVTWSCDAIGGAKVGPDAWTAEMAIPWAAIGGVPKPDQTWRVNLRRHRAGSGGYFSWWSRTGPEARAPHRFGTMQFVDAAPAIHHLALGYEWVGLNRLTARAHGPAAGFFLAIRHADDAEGIQKTALPVENMQAIELNYPITIRTRDKLIIELFNAEQSYFRQLVDTRVNPFISLEKINRTLDLLEQKAASTTDGRYRAALTAASDRGREELAQLEAQVQAAVEAGNMIREAPWKQVATPVLELQELTVQPVLWTHEPLDQSRSEMLPAKIRKLHHLDIAAAINEQESGSLLLSNPFANTDMHLRIEMGKVQRLEGEGPRPLTRSNITIHEAVMIPTRAHGVIGDPISQLDKAGRIHVPENQTREVWFMVDTYDLAPGLYRVPVQIFPMDYATGVRPTAFDLRVRIWDIHLPKKMPITVFNFEYDRGVSGNPDYHADLLRCRTNVFNISSTPVPDDDGNADFAAVDTLLANVPDDCNIWFDTWFMRSRGWQQPRFEIWLRQWVAHLQSRGFDYDRWTLHIFDESLSDDFLECARQIKRIDPNVRIMQDHMDTPEKIRQFAPYIDVWCPHFKNLDQADGLAAMKATGKPVWTYNCAPSPSLYSPQTHRSMPLRAWLYGLDGVTTWTYSQSIWNDVSREQNFGLFFGASNGGSVPSKRFEGWREGMDDYLYVATFESALKQNGASTAADNELLEKARELGRIKEDTTLAHFREVRNRLAHRILELRGRTLASDFPN